MAFVLLDEAHFFQLVLLYLKVLTMYLYVRRVSWNLAPMGLAIVAAIVIPAIVVVPNACVAQDEVKKDGKTVEEWIRDFDSGFGPSQAAKKALAEIGEPAVPALTALVRDNHRHAGYAVRTLGEIGPAARPVIAEILRLGNDREAKDPQGWTWNMPLRPIIFTSIHKMTWAADELIPMLEKVGKDPEETELARGTAVSALGGMGPKALPVLRAFTKSESSNVRENAVAAIVKNQLAAGKSRAESYQEIVDQNPFDSNVPSYLGSMKGIYNLGRLHAPTQRIKKLYRSELEKKPDPQIAWQLASIIRNGLSGTDLQWAAPADSYRQRWKREDPDENYETLATVLEIAHANSPRGSDLWKKSGTSLAKLRLLQGDWDGMNKMLVRLGQTPVPEERRPNLPPPPIDWSNLEKDWQTADEAVRSGKCGIEFRFLRRGQKLKGVQGVHVLVKARPEPKQVFSSGIAVDTLFHATQPMGERPFGSFGYRGNDRTKCRYGISDKNGLVRIEGLPFEPKLIEILVPTSNFVERGRTWDLMMTTTSGVQIADRSDPKSVSSSKPPGLLELEEDGLVRYPVMFVRSHLSASIVDWDSVDKDDFVLTWTGPKELEVDHYNVKLTLSAPAQHLDNVASAPVIATQSVKATERSWPVGVRGVGNLRLAPGNFYVIEVEAVQDGTVVASLPRQRVWVPWEHRDSAPPLSGDYETRPAFYNDIFLRTNVNGSSLEKRLPVLIRDSPQMFETEYHRLGMAWLDLHKNKAGAVDQLRKLIEELPAGNVVRSTAQSLVDASANEQPIPRRLKFVAP